MARLRPFTSVVLAAGTWAIVVALSIGLPLAALGWGNSPVPSWGVSFGLAGPAFAWGVYRVRLEVDNKEIRVFNVRKTYRIPLSSVAKIDIVYCWLSPDVIIPGSAS